MAQTSGSAAEEEWLVPGKCSVRFISAAEMVEMWRLLTERGFLFEWMCVARTRALSLHGKLGISVIMYWIKSSKRISPILTNWKGCCIWQRVSLVDVRRIPFSWQFFLRIIKRHKSIVQIEEVIKSSSNPKNHWVRLIWPIFHPHLFNSYTGSYCLSAIFTTVPNV